MIDKSVAFCTTTRKLLDKAKGNWLLQSPNLLKQSIAIQCHGKFDKKYQTE